MTFLVLFGQYLKKYQFKPKQKSVPKLVSLEDFWQISEFQTKNCFVRPSDNFWVKKFCFFKNSQNIDFFKLNIDARNGFFHSFPFQKKYTMK